MTNSDVKTIVLEQLGFAVDAASKGRETYAYTACIQHALDQLDDRDATPHPNPSGGTPVALIDLCPVCDKSDACTEFSWCGGVDPAHCVYHSHQTSERDAPPGYVLVPVEPTEEMIEAGCECDAEELVRAKNRSKYEKAGVKLEKDYASNGQILAYRYQAMLKAAQLPAAVPRDAILDQGNVTDGYRWVLQSMAVPLQEPISLLDPRHPYNRSAAPSPKAAQCPLCAEYGRQMMKCGHCGGEYVPEELHDANLAASLKAPLQEPAEPVAWWWDGFSGKCFKVGSEYPDGVLPRAEPLYAAPSLKTPSPLAAG